MDKYLYIGIGIIILLIINIVVGIISQNNKKQQIIDSVDDKLDKFRQEINSSTSSYISNMTTYISETLNNNLDSVNKTLHNNGLVEETKLDNVRNTMITSLANIQNDTNQKLEQIRKTVDEKLQETLETKLTQSFKLVSQQLELVHKGLGEMNSLASGVGDLKKVLTNVKTTGILGEYQLGAILKEILSKEQYDTNINTIPNSSERVEFAIKLPADDNSFIYLPIDSKFPATVYSQLQTIKESGQKQLIAEGQKAFINALKKDAKDIHEKYVAVPYTTEFAIMFLPTEGLYCEAINLGLMEVLQRDYKVTIAGPSNMAALLNSLQMGFKTLAIQKRSSEVWKILGNVKTEFVKFNEVLNKTQQRLQQTSDELDSLVGTRSRAINKQLQALENNELFISEIKQEEN